MRMIVIFHTDDYRVAYYTIIMAVYFTDIIYTFSLFPPETTLVVLQATVSMLSLVVTLLDQL